MPGLVKYTTPLPTGPDESPYDGVAELYYESEAALNAAIESGGEATLEDGGTFLNFDRCLGFVVDETVQMNETLR